MLGYSGTQGDNVYVHDTEFYDNAMGLVSDSETDHPNYPENNLTLENNVFRDNNFNIYAADSDVATKEFDESGTGFSGTAIPVGIGIFLPSGNDNRVQRNYIWNNSRFGVWLASGEGLVVGPTSEPAAPPFASSGNRFVQNVMFNPAAEDPAASQNGVDFGWDGAGLDNCWQDNATATGAPPTTDAAFLPPCDPPIPAGVPSASNALQQIGISMYDGEPVCSRLELEPCSWGPGPQGTARNVPEGEGGTSDRSYVPHPAACGPSSPSSCWM